MSNNNKVQIIKKRLNFNENDQEAIAIKLQKLSDQRKGKTGLGYSNIDISSISSSIKPSCDDNSCDNKTETIDNKVNKIKESIRNVEESKTASLLERKQAIAKIEGELNTSSSGFPLDEKDLHHQTAIFSSGVSENTAPSSSRKDEFSGKSSLFNKRKTTVAADAPLYKRLHVGDTVYAYYAGDKGYHKADIVSVMHGGYHSAQYDVKYHGYNEKVTLSWTDLKPFSELRNDDESKGNNKMEGESGEVDAFGRSLSERTSEAEVNKPSTLNETREGNEKEDDNVLANIEASKKFMNGITTGNKACEEPLNTVKSDVPPVVYEAPVMNLKFSLKTVVDPAFLANCEKGEWRNIKI